MSKLNLKNGKVEDFTIVLAGRDFRKLGQLTGIKSEIVQNGHHLNSANEMSFSLYKYDLLKIPNVYTEEIYQKILHQKEILWERIVDHRLIWIKELDEYYDIKVSVTDSKETLKTITATSLCEAELSQYNIDSLEINSESDILREDYEVTTFCNFANPKASLLHRALADKAPHYTIEHVDESLQNLQRTFSVSGTNIYNFFVGEVSEQFNCLFRFNSAKRSISVYDLYTTCLDCGNRDDFYDECPKCKSKNLKYFGKDTTILIDKDNLTDAIQLDTNTDETKNCLKLIAGDDLMTATVRLLNQNGSDYLYYLSEFQIDDMPKELTNKLVEYQKDYDSYTEEYQKALSDYYNLTDEILYLESGMMPAIEQAEVTAKTEAEKLTEENLSPLGLSYVTKGTSSSTVNAALKNYAKVYVKTGYVKLNVDGEFTYVGEHIGETALESYNYGTWTGKITVTNYSDEEDVVVTEPLTIMVYDKYQEFVTQKVLKGLAEESEEGSVFDVLAIEDIDGFKEALTYYGKNRLQSFYDAIQGALDVLIQLNQGSMDSELYDALYVPYYEKLQACQLELDKRQAEIDELQINLDSANKTITDIQAKLNLRTYLGEELYKIYCSYKREDTYENSNYISDGLSNTELLDRAKEFLEAAKKELKRVAEPQYSISTTLYNLLVLDEFKPIVDYFELGNWIRIKVDGQLYRLRLIGYTISFGNIQNISVEFSTATKIKDVVHETQQVLQSAKTISQNFSYVAKQAEKGNAAKSNVDNWINNGLNSALIQVKNNDESLMINEHGILCRYKDKDTDTFDPRQLKILYNNIVLTKDNWNTVSQAIGEHSYTVYNPATNQNETYTGYGMTAEFLAAPHVVGKQIIGGQIFSSNYSNGSNNREAAGTFIDLDNGTLSLAAGNLRYDGTDLIISSKSLGDSLQDVDITAENLHINAGNIDGYIKLSQIDGTINGKIQNTQINTVDISQVTGSIIVDSDNINGQIKNDQIASVAFEKITGNIVADSVDAGNISGILSSSQIDSNLNNKNITGSFEGLVNVSSVTTTSEDTIYQTITGEFTVGNIAMKFINGLLVNATPVVTS